MAQHGAPQEQPPACLILSEYQGSDVLRAYAQIAAQIVGAQVRAMKMVIDFACSEMRHMLCAMKCVIDFELGELRCCRSCSAAIW
ncbi:hypothetical protein AVEN_107647-1 [Araneus ventricosus]|uniref:Uncharacterized protein n=1 Tax=Araneus ventricosus TaxID=182803 RepID=A0A4Y2U648_ARAVE|nr:hypothetical protein AVEN_231746-1 [Araneus ventricosus]GBO06832.1 hypothetical protein AVEN_133139-1 [Araneus ventricosus]GBO07981.1 hypothetical protein AVEN_95022-1 [Araneus ventricosus]GBO07983.1 hypothetical protein AVEN_107647-1 [Araneus ventricosus]